jgi:porin
MKRKLTLLALAGMILPSASMAQTGNENPFSFSASYIGDVVGNFSGGIKKGSAYLGMANLRIGFDTQKAGWWKGGELFVNGCNTHGDNPTKTLIGDFQTVSNIEADSHTYLYELWYRQIIGKTSVTVGLQDFNSDYAVSENGGAYINSYFGIHSVCSDNVPVPIFPLTALGLNFHWDISQQVHWQVALFDGRPDDFNQNKHNLKWSLGKRQGFLAVTEAQWKQSLVKGQEGIYKIGVYYHHSKMGEDEGRHRDYGVYLIGDQNVNERLALFTQIGLSRKKDNNHYACFGAGANYKNFSAKRPDDMVGLAFNHAVFDKSIGGNETAIELVYNFQVNNNVYLRPDIQYIINPAGTDMNLNNALVGILRVGIEF